MKREKITKNNIKLEFTIVCTQFFISALSVWMILAGFNADGSMNLLGYVAGVVFWLGLLGGIISYIIFFKKRFQKPNMFNVFSNKPAMVADGLLLASLVATVYLFFKEITNQLVGVLFVFLLLISFYSHFLLNGKVFLQILNKK